MDSVYLIEKKILEGVVKVYVLLFRISIPLWHYSPTTIT